MHTDIVRVEKRTQRGAQRELPASSIVWKRHSADVHLRRLCTSMSTRADVAAAARVRFQVVSENSLGITSPPTRFVSLGIVIVGITGVAMSIQTTSGRAIEAKGVKKKKKGGADQDIPWVYGWLYNLLIDRYKWSIDT